MQLEFHQVDAFSDRLFHGNPAVVYRLNAWLAEGLMQQIAAEHNQAETAFVVAEDGAWRIRWFTPRCEVPLCGHATLASAHVLFACYGVPGERLDFSCQSGALSVSRERGHLVLDFPAQYLEETAMAETLERILGQPVLSVRGGKELLAELASEQAVRDCRPDLDALARLPGLGVIVTAPGRTHDFVSRYFAPGVGIDEDPVTGSAHCILTPYWAERLGKRELSAYQCSARGGELHCSLVGERVKIAGQAVLVASGRLYLDED
ncbi:PhzF family phenazine biosynthesis protein [Pseudomonas zhanjiangensis]|uniref:PhzF family phenazine biosynthesis protein n=1 Tax=Pseudomonas zhanjiangensis TaxID=3239015 RepID=A0ABV3YNV4_9PSED